MITNIRYCKKCGQAYDIGTNFDICPNCRIKQKEREGDEKGRT